MRVLSVDDSRTARHVIRNMAEVLGLEFLEAENGVAALKLLDSNSEKIDLIILDWEMPEMNGQEFLEIIKQHERHRNIPVIMVTTVTQIKSRIKRLLDERRERADTNNPNVKKTDK